MKLMFVQLYRYAEPVEVDVQLTATDGAEQFCFPLFFGSILVVVIEYQ